MRAEKQKMFNAKPWIALAAFAALLCVLAALTIAASAPPATASGVIVSMDLLSSSTINATGCAPNTPDITSFGSVQPQLVTKTKYDCVVQFGSTNDSASLRLAQSDGVGSAMNHPTDTWTRNTGGSTRMAFVTSGYGMVLALRTSGQVYRSTDNGVTWSAPHNSILHMDGGISIGSATTAWGTTAAPTVQRSTNINGGAPTWSSTATDPGMIRTYGIAAASASEAWVSGSNGAISRTTDSGASWTSFVSGATSNLYGMQRLDADSLIAWGDGALVQTTDALTWRAIQSPLMTSKIYSAIALSDNTIIAVTNNAIWLTTNATAPTPTWTRTPAGSQFGVRAIAFENSLKGYIAGEYGVLLRTNDGGATWVRSDLGSGASIHSATVPAAGSAVVVGAGSTILETSDSGDTWTSRLAGSTPSWTAVDATTDGFVWRVGGDGLIERSNDAGSTWSAQTSNTGADLFGVHAFDPLHVVAVGRQGVIVTTADGGATWTVRSSGVSLPLYDVTGANYGIAWAVGEDQTVLRSNDYGITWSTVFSLPGKALTTVVSTDETHAVAFGYSGAAARTADGVTWTSFTPPSGGDINGAVAVLAGTSTIGLYDGSDFYRSNDHGQTWADTGDLPNSGFTGLTWVSPTELYGSSQGRLFRSLDSGATWSSVAAGIIVAHWMTSITTVDRSKVIVVGDGNLSGSTGSDDPVPDYQLGVNDWYNDGTEAFGACLSTTDATATWTPNAGCDQSSDAVHWKAVPQHTDASSEIARTASGDGIRSVNLRFGLRVAPNQTAGELSAGLTFVVIAPAV